MVKNKFSESINCYQSLIESSMKSFGLKTVESKVYAIAYCSPSAISLDELSSISGYSLATISTTVKFLTTYHMLNKIKSPGSKKIYVKAQRKVSQMLSQKITSSIEFVINPKKRSLPPLINQLKKDIKLEKSTSKKQEGKHYLKLLQDDLEESLVLEEIYLKILKFIDLKIKKT